MLRERITVTLEPELIQAVDLLVDKQTLRNRSHAVEHLLKEGIGLHELTRAFLFLDEQWTQDQLEVALSICAEVPISTLYVCGPRAVDAQAIAGAHSVSVPSDFGSGGALLLKRQELDHPFLIIWVGPNLKPVRSIARAYVFHRQHHASLTRLVASVGTDHYGSIGIDVCQPTALNGIPAGIVQLETAVYPALIQEGNVRTYVTA